MIKNISLDLLVPFENHPFKERSGIDRRINRKHKRKRIA